MPPILPDAGPTAARAARLFCLPLLLALLPLVAAGPVRAQPQRTMLIGVWTPDATGLLDASGVPATLRSSHDLRLLDRIGQRAGLGLVLIPMERSRIEAALIAGTIDFALPEITGTPVDGIILSRPYRRRSDVLFLSSTAPPIRGHGIEAIRDALARGMRLGVERDLRQHPDLEALARDWRFAERIVRTLRSSDSLDRMLAGELDAFLAPRLPGLEAIADRPGAMHVVTAHPEPIFVHDVHLRLSARTVDRATVTRINDALWSLEADGTGELVRERSAAPILLRLGASGIWFSALDMIGTIAFALSGVLIARRESYSVLGAFVLAALPAVGGGVVRDLLVGRSPIGLLRSPVPLLVILGVVLAGYVCFRVGDLIGDPDAADRPATRLGRVVSFRNVHELTDAMGLAAFTVIGVAVAVTVGAEPWWLWGPLCAALSGGGGGVLRDVLRADSRNPALRTSFYMEVCVIWGLALAVATQTLAREDQPFLLQLAVVLTLLGVFLTRVAVVWSGMRSPRF